MRIVSLLPALTELVCALGRRDDLVGVTHECDEPAGVERLPHLTRSRIPASASSAAIDGMVAAEGGSLYDLDGALLEELRPDVILTQAQCDVCAVNEQSVRCAAAGLPGNPRVESVNPTDLAGVFAMFARVGALLDAQDAAAELRRQFDATVAEIAGRRQGRERRRAVHLEWTDPPFCSGHWNPELVGLAGGLELIGTPGAPSRRIGWDEVAAADPDVILLAPCGFSVERAWAELEELESRPQWRALRAVRAGDVAISDGSAYFSRPGPRLETSLRIMAATIAPELFEDLAPRSGWRRMRPQS